MKEEEFVKKYPKERIEVPIYFYCDEEGNVVIDEEGISDEFQKELGDILEKAKIEEKDELQKIVAEKLKRDKKWNK